ncbi:MAG: DUF6798 domain-containing protein [Bryobacterales bacterium]|nr:hypothetical protein [Bryobacteraceae bacterium]MDW8129160.1 DUF6798 domain-containing protein [Bryobacterales bacterium]
MTPVQQRISIALAIAALTAASFWLFPGHTWLQADTQIYIPILERLWDPGTLARDPVAERPHVAFTVYDEVAIGLRRLTGLDFHAILTAQQLLFRALGILGIYLIATALGLSVPSALLAAAVFSLGATVVGPSVLTLEYEPVPRGFAGPLVFLALGLAGRGRELGAGVAATLAFLYHPPTAAAFWAVYFVLALWPSPPPVMARRIAGLIPLALGAALLLVLSRLQPGISEPQMLFRRLDAELEALQRMRAAYNWIGLWESAWLRLHVLLWLLGLAAFWRLRRAGAFRNRDPQAWPVIDLESFLIGLPLAGMLCLPLSYWLLDGMKWALIAQVQPARNLMYVMTLSSLMAVAAAAKAGEAGRWWESLLWLVPVYAIPAHTRLLQFDGVALATPLGRRRALLVLAMAAVSAAALQARPMPRLAKVPLVSVAIAAPFFVVPWLGQVKNYPDLHHAELDELAAWARANTSPAAVFLFPDAGRELFPGIFRAKALRAVYVDWKGGGQVNFLRHFASEWWRRWTQVMEGGFRASRWPQYVASGADYLVLRRPRSQPAQTPVFANSRYVVYRLK